MGGTAVLELLALFLALLVLVQLSSILLLPKEETHMTTQKIPCMLKGYKR